MKKLFFSVRLAILMFACKSTSATSKTDRKSQVAIKGAGLFQ
jgi:hypothetical protein